MSGELIVFVTCPADLSQQLARTVVEEHLAACVNIIPGITSVYFWQDKLCQESEDLLIIKSNESSWHQLASRIKELHTYDTPEIVSVSIRDGFEPYLQWLNQACLPKKTS